MLAAVLAGLFGLLIGSFLNVCIYRLPRDLSVYRPSRSFCPNCERAIAWYDNVPLLSYAVLGGRCRGCSTAIPVRYPLVEALTALLFFAMVMKLGPTLAAAKFCLFCAIQVALLFTDLESRILPDEFTLGGAVTGVALAAFVPPAPFFLLFLPVAVPLWAAFVLDAAASAVALGLFFWFMAEVYLRIRKREGLGLGDVKMAACNAAFLGLSPALLSVAAGSVLGSIIGLSYIFLRGKDPQTYYLPFGSFLAIGALAVALWMVPA